MLEKFKQFSWPEDLGWLLCEGKKSGDDLVAITGDESDDSRRFVCQIERYIRNSEEKVWKISLDQVPPSCAGRLQKFISRANNRKRFVFTDPRDGQKYMAKFYIDSGFTTTDKMVMSALDVRMIWKVWRDSWWQRFWGVIASNPIASALGVLPLLALLLDIAVKIKELVSCV